MQQDNGGTTRRRGVRASRVKLNQALAAAGLKAQAALAERIADIEGLDTVPRAMVNRVFRERRVDPQTLERVARALDVPAYTLYKSGSELQATASDEAADAAAAPVDTAKRKRRPLVALGILATGLLALLVGQQVPDDVVCGLRERLSTPAAPSGSLNIVIARFADDPDNAAQQWLASQFSTEPSFRDLVSVTTSCRRPVLSTIGDFSATRLAARERLQAWLQSRGGDVLLLGRRIGEEVRVQIVSLRDDRTAVTFANGGKKISLEELSVEVPVPLNGSGNNVADLKRLTLEFILPDRSELAQVRDRAAASFDMSFDWLRESIVADRNLLRSIDRKTGRSLWGQVQGQLCYKERLLGDIEFSLEDYQRAADSCRAALETRSREQFPDEWLTLHIHLGTALARQHLFMQSSDEALALLDEAIGTMSIATDALVDRRSTHRAGIAYMNLGGVLLMRGDRIGSGDEALAAYDQGKAMADIAREGLDPSEQPEDWALAMQNSCVSLYRRSLLVESGRAIPLARSAVEHCRAASSVLTPEANGPTWGMVQNNLGVSIAILAQATNDADTLREAIGTFQEAQLVYTRDRLPVNWAEVEGNIGELSCNLAKMTKDESLLDASDAHVNGALAVALSRDINAYARYWGALSANVQRCRKSRLESCVCSPS